jgi:fermentation-respiration switch protein FrsA (DUF1100 family)
VLEFIVRQFLYYPIKLPADAPIPPYARGAEEVWLSAPDGEKIHGLYWKAPDGRPTVLFFHGNAQSVFEWSLVREDLSDLDCGLLLVDYPGYGKSSGKPNEAGSYAAGQAALDWLVAEAGVSVEQVVLFGKSLGGGVATYVAQDKPIKGLILESTFKSIPSVARILLPMIPADGIFKSERYESIERIGSIRVPILVVHGTVDELIPLAEGQDLFEKANPPKDLYLVEGAGHNNVSYVAGAEYGRRLRQWLDSTGSPQD